MSFSILSAVDVNPTCDETVSTPPRPLSYVVTLALFRGDPHHDFQFSVLVNYRDTAYPLEIVTVDMLQGRDG